MEVLKKAQSMEESELAKPLVPGRCGLPLGQSIFSGADWSPMDNVVPAAPHHPALARPPIAQGPRTPPFLSPTHIFGSSVPGRPQTGSSNTPTSAPASRPYHSPSRPSRPPPRTSAQLPSPPPTRTPARCPADFAPAATSPPPQPTRTNQGPARSPTNGIPSHNQSRSGLPLSDAGGGLKPNYPDGIQGRSTVSANGPRESRLCSLRSAPAEN